jgi:hypothetical protein
MKHEASICKVFGTETAGRVVDRCIQIFGGMGVSREMPLERWYRELRIKRIGEGPLRDPSHGDRAQPRGCAQEHLIMSVDVTVDQGICTIVINRPSG